MKRNTGVVSLGLALVLAAAWKLSAQVQPPATRAAGIDAGNYPNLQAALDAVPAAGGVVRIPAGTFTITEPLVVRRPEIRIEGVGAATVIINANTAGEPTILARPDDYDKKGRLWRVQFANFRLCGDPQAINGKSTDPKSGDGIRALGIQEIYLSNVSIDHHGGNGIALIDCYEDPRIIGCILTYNRKTGIHLVNCHDIVVSANQLEENQDALRCIDSFNLCMTGNNIDDHLGDGVIIENTYGSVLSGNMIEECEGTAIILDRDCYGITLSANVIAHDMAGGIDLRDAWGCAVSANTFVLCNRFGLRIGPDSGRIAVTGNAFSNSFIGSGKTKRPMEAAKDIQKDLAFGLLLDHTRDVVVTGNLFSGLSGPAVQTLGDKQRLLIQSNLGTGAEHPEGLSLPGSVGSTVIEKDNITAAPNSEP